MQHSHFFRGYNIVRMLGSGLHNYWKLLIPYLAIDFGFNGFEVGIVAHVRDIMGIFGTIIAYRIFHKVSISRVIPIQITIIVIILLSIILIPFFEGNMRIVFLVCIGSIIMLMMRINIVAQYQVLHAVKIPPNERGKYLGKMQTMGDVGSFTVVTFGGLCIVHFGWIITTWVAIAGVMLFAIYSFFSYRNFQNMDYASDDFHAKIPISSWMTRGSFLTLLILMSDSVATEGIIVFLPLLLLQNGISMDFFPYVSGAVMVGSMAGRQLGGMADRYGYQQIFLWVETVMVLILLIFTEVDVLWLAMSMAFLLGVGIRGTSPIKGVLLMQAVPKEYFHKIHTYSSQINASANIFVGLLWGAMVMMFNYSAPMYGMAFFGIVAIISMIALGKHQKGTL